MKAEQEIIETVDEIAGDWIAREIEQSKPLLKRHAAAMDDFAQWVHSYGLTLPVSGRVAAGYLLELAAEGASLPDLTRAANAVAFCFDRMRTYLDIRPIRAVLALARAQTRPNRVLH